MKDGIKYALLVGVGKYNMADIADLPTYKNDCELMNDALVRGLLFKQDNIRISGEDGEVTSQSFSYAILNFKKSLTEKDTFVFYYTGHGLDNALYFTDTLVELKSIVRVIDSLPARRKLIILDCCHSGAAKTPDTVMIPGMLDLQLSDFIDHGTTIMASSGADQNAAFDEGHSMYTGMLCKAIMSDKTTRHKRKSLWDINNMVQYLMDEWNQEHLAAVQYPIFRSSEIGSISFEMNTDDTEAAAETSLKNTPVFSTDDYTITEVKSLSTAEVKRNSAFVMLKCEETKENIIRITKEVVNLVKGMNLDSRHYGYTAKIVWCYFGMDASDMLRSNYVLYTIWSEDPAQRAIHFKSGKHSDIVGDICICRNIAYEMVSELSQPDSDPEEYKQKLNIAVSNIINMGEMFVRDISEVYNKTMDIATFREAYKIWIRKVKKDYIKLTDMSSPPDELYDYSEKVLDLIGWLVDLGIYVDGDKDLMPMDHWVIKNAVRRYHDSIEIISRLQKSIAEAE